MRIDDIKNKITSVEGWLAPEEVEFLYKQAKKLENKGVIVEIGSYKGKSTICLAGGSEAGKSIKVYAVDPYITDLEHKRFNESKSSFENFKKNIKNAGLEYLIEPIVKKSKDAVKNWNKPIEFLWIDGDHSYAGAKEDFILWEPFVIDGGIIAFHDCDDANVQRVIKECIFTSPYFSEVGIVNRLAFGTKRLRPISLREKIRNRLIFFLIKYRALFRRIPFPKKTLDLMAKFGKKSLRLKKQSE